MPCTWQVLCTGAVDYLRPGGFLAFEVSSVAGVMLKPTRDCLLSGLNICRRPSGTCVNALGCRLLPHSNRLQVKADSCTFLWLAILQTAGPPQVHQVAELLRSMPANITGASASRFFEAVQVMADCYGVERFVTASRSL